MNGATILTIIIVAAAAYGLYRAACWIGERAVGDEPEDATLSRLDVLDGVGTRLPPLHQPEPDAGKHIDMDKPVGHAHAHNILRILDRAG